jgi:putative flippase GtrA
MRKNLIRFFRYFVTGGAAAVVDTGGFALLDGAGVAIPIAATSSFFVAAVVNYVLTARFVFGQRATARRFWLFFVFALVGLVINVGVTVSVVAAFAVPPVLGKLIGIGVAFSANFTMNVLIVFSLSSPPAPVNPPC